MLNPGTIWITGISASGKTTLGNRLYENLKQMGIDNVDFLEGEELRKHLDRNYGYSVKERFAVIKKLASLANESNKNGKIVIIATISHKRKMREFSRKKISNFMEVYLKCDVDICANRDYKDHYRKAFAGKYDMFVGVTDLYETSENPELVIDTGSMTVDDCSNILLNQVLIFLNSSWLQDGNAC